MHSQVKNPSLTIPVKTPEFAKLSGSNLLLDSPSFLWFLCCVMSLNTRIYALPLLLFLILSSPYFAVPDAAAQGTEADILIAQAILAYEERRYEEAIGLLTEALQIDPNNVEALYYTGLVHIATKDYVRAVEALESAGSKSPTDLAIKFQLGVAYFLLEQYDKAEPLLTEVFKAQPQKENVGYYVGFMRYRNKDYQGALAAFRAGRSADPNILQLTKFYSGLTLGILGLPEQAAGEFEEVARMRTSASSPITGPADRLRDTMVTAREKAGRFHGELRVGAFYDTNVRTNPLSSPDPFVTSIRQFRTNTPGELVNARFDYTFFRKGGLDTVASYSFFKTWNSDVSSFNLMNHLGQVAAYYRGLIYTLPYQLSAQYSYDTTLLGDERFLNRHSASLLGTLIESEHHMTILQGRLQIKDFAPVFLVGAGTFQSQDRSGTNTMFGLTHVLRFSQDRHLIRIGYQYDVDDTTGADWYYRGHRFLAGGQYTLPWKDIRAKLDYDVHFRDYPHPNQLFGFGLIEQKVTEHSIAERIEIPLPFNFTVALDNLTTLSRANLPQVFRYNRNVSTVSLSWAW
jgi:tetratricopeptide (TPR) repeat protein